MSNVLTKCALQSLDPESYGLRRRAPDGCEPNATCDYFVGISVNIGDPSYIDVYLSGLATGWVAVGFSPTNNMVSQIKYIHTYTVAKRYYY